MASSAEGRGFSEIRQMSQSIARWHTMEEYSGMILAQTAEMSRVLATDQRFSDEEKVQKMDEMRKCAVALAKVDYEAIERKKITKEFTNKLGRLSSSDEADPLEVALAVQQDFVRYSAATKQAANPVAAKNKCVLEISKLIQIQTGENDDDVQEDLSAPSARPTKCPVSGGELSNPHINRCGHVFSLGGIIGYLRQNAARGDRHVDPKLLEQIPAHWSSRCPIAHCRGKVQRDSLRKDFQSILSQRQQTATAREEEEGDALEVEDLS